MRKMFLGMLMVIGVVGVMAGVALASTSSANINLLVTPITTTSLTVNPTYYNFGNVAVKTSTCSVTALVITNNGSVGITVDKTVWTDDSWDIALSSAVQNGFNLYAMVNASAAGKALFDTGLSTFTKVLQTFNALTNSSAAAVSMVPDATNNLWFRLDMPKSSSTSSQKTIHVRLRGTTQ